MAAGLGFEPRQTESESVVLPLHYPAKSAIASEISNCSFPQQRKYYHKEGIDASINLCMPIIVLIVYNGLQIYHS